MWPLYIHEEGTGNMEKGGYVTEQGFTQLEPGGW